MTVFHPDRQVSSYLFFTFHPAHKMNQPTLDVAHKPVTRQLPLELHEKILIFVTIIIIAIIVTTIVPDTTATIRI